MHRGAGGDGVDEVVLHGRVDDCLVLEDLLQGVADLRSAGILGEITASPGPERVEHRIGRRRRWSRTTTLVSRSALAQEAGGLDAVAARHPQVHEDDVRAELAAKRDRLGPVRSGPHDLDVVEQAEHHRRAPRGPPAGRRR